MRRRILSLLLIAVTCNVAAQELSIKSVSLQPTDLTAKQRPVLDLNGDTCALIKIKVANLKGLQFTNKLQYQGDVIQEGDTYLIYKSPFASRQISYQHSDYLPGDIDLADYGYKRLKSGKTYLVVMEAPATGIGKSIIVLKVQPQSAVVTFNGKQASVIETGFYEFPVSEGSYSYSVAAQDFKPVSGTVTVAAGETKTQSLRLQPITHEVNVTCNVSSAHVFVDNIDYGKVGKLQMPQGQHVVRIQADGYLDNEETIGISADTPQLTYNLKKNENRIDIHATPVTIISSSKRIYKNNKELKGWTSGKPIMFMPGKYMISDVNDNYKIIEVGSKPMKVTL